MKKVVVVNDTNVFIDLLDIGLLEEFFSLPWEIHTTDFVMLELIREGQQALVSSYKDKGKLYVPVFEGEEMLEIARMYQNNNISFTDYTVWYYAKKNKYILLTGDRKLRTASSKDGVEVHGTIYILDNLVTCGILSYERAIEKLNLLYKSNSRLPQDEKEKRLALWTTALNQSKSVMARKDYAMKDLAGSGFNAKYPPNYELNGRLYNGYKNGVEETLFFDFAVQGYDLYFTYKGKAYHFLSEEDYVAYCDEKYTTEYQRFSDGNAALEQFEIDGKSIIELIDELKDVEPI